MGHLLIRAMTTNERTLHIFALAAMVEVALENRARVWWIGRPIRYQVRRRRENLVPTTGNFPRRLYQRQKRKNIVNSHSVSNLRLIGKRQ